MYLGVLSFLRRALLSMCYELFSPVTALSSTPWHCYPSHSFFHMRYRMKSIFSFSFPAFLKEKDFISVSPPKTMYVLFRYAMSVLFPHLFEKSIISKIQ